MVSEFLSRDSWARIGGSRPRADRAHGSFARDRARINGGHALPRERNENLTYKSSPVELSRRS